MAGAGAGEGQFAARRDIEDWLMGIYKLYSCFRGEERLEELGDICCHELGE